MREGLVLLRLAFQLYNLQLSKCLFVDELLLQRLREGLAAVRYLCRVGLLGQVRGVLDLALLWLLHTVGLLMLPCRSWLNEALVFYLLLPLTMHLSHYS